jgi:hypothetical protein
MAHAPLTVLHIKLPLNNQNGTVSLQTSFTSVASLSLFGSLYSFGQVVSVRGGQIWSASKRFAHTHCLHSQAPSTAWPVSQAGMGFKTGDGLESASDIGLGCMGITAFYGAPMSQSDATALLKATYVNCLALGCSSGKLSLSDATAAQLAQLRPLLETPALFTVAHASTCTHSRQVRCWLPPF